MQPKLGSAPLRRKGESHGYFFNRPLTLEFHHLFRCMLAVLLVSNCACVKNYAKIGNYNFHTLKSERSKSGKEWHFDGLHYSKPMSLSDTIKKAMKVQVNNTAKDADEARKAELLEEQDPVLATLSNKVKADPRSAEAHFNLGVVYHRYRVFDKAYAEYQNAIRLNPVNAAYFEVMGRLWRDWRAPQQGINDLQRALQLKPDFVEAWNSLGTIYDALGDFTQSQRCYLKALEINPDLDFVHNNLCFSFLQEGNLEKAIYHGNIAVRLSPDFKVAHNNLGLALGMLKNPAQALQEFRKATDEAGAHNNLGIVLLKRQEVSDAMEQFRIAAKLRPFYKVAAENYNYARTLKSEIERNGKKVAAKQEPGGKFVDVALENTALFSMNSPRSVESDLPLAGN